MHEEVSESIAEVSARALKEDAVRSFKNKLLTQLEMKGKMQHLRHTRRQNTMKRSVARHLARVSLHRASSTGSASSHKDVVKSTSAAQHDMDATRHELEVQSSEELDAIDQVRAELDAYQRM